MRLLLVGATMTNYMTLHLSLGLHYSFSGVLDSAAASYSIASGKYRLLRAIGLSDKRNSATMSSHTTYGTASPQNTPFATMPGVISAYISRSSLPLYHSSTCGFFFTGRSLYVLCCCWNVRMHERAAFRRDCISMQLLDTVNNTYGATISSNELQKRYSAQPLLHARSSIARTHRSRIEAMHMKGTLFNRRYVEQEAQMFASELWLGGLSCILGNLSSGPSLIEPSQLLGSSPWHVLHTRIKRKQWAHTQECNHLTSIASCTHSLVMENTDIHTDTAC